MKNINTKIIKHLMDNDAFEDDVNYDTITGVARQVLAKGYDSLTDAQKYVLTPYLSRLCDGIEDPGGYHNDCNKAIEDNELFNAYQTSGFDNSVLCEDCQEEASFYQYQYNKLMDE